MLFTKVVFNVKVGLFLLYLFLISPFTFGQDQLLNKIGVSKNQAQSKVTAIVFLGEDCPISQKYMVRLKSINDKFSTSELKMFGIIPGKIKRKELDYFLSKYRIEFPVRVDKHYNIANNLKAEVTPEVFLFDSGGNLKYQGAIDDWYYELGHYRQGASENYLIDAIEAVIKGDEPSIKKTKAIGCLIQSINK